MSAPQNVNKVKKKFQFAGKFILPLLDIFTLAIWGIVLLKYWRSGELNLLIHPNYFGLVVVTGLALLSIAAWKMLLLLKKWRQQSPGKSATMPLVQHVSLFPPGWSSSLLLAIAILGLIVKPKVFASDTAVQRGISESATVTRLQPQAFKPVSKPEERSLIDWARTLNIYPEPDTYTGQAVKVKGFVVHPPELPPKYLLVSRFVITCCAADAYPVGLPVKLKVNKDKYPVDSWIEVEGKMITENLEGKRQLTIEASSIEKIDEPDNPYNY
ncbi:MAG: TIGR03943 family protein [Symploca sp. SIO2C1]|nr:TIGR03943 family protein [Symploca sp. SIO2C1]